MSKRQWIMVLGVILIILPFLGFPAVWNIVFIVIAAVMVVVIAYLIKPTEQVVKNTNVPFVEYKAPVAQAAAPTEEPLVCAFVNEAESASEPVSEPITSTQSPEQK